MAKFGVEDSDSPLHLQGMARQYMLRHVNTMRTEQLMSARMKRQYHISAPSDSEIADVERAAKSLYQLYPDPPVV